MGAKNRFRQVLTIFVALLTVAVPAYIAYDIHAKGSAPEKRVELLQFLTINPMEDLSALGNKVTLSLCIEDQTTDNLSIARAWLRNVGATPILPTDYAENISINVPKPWKILAVEGAKDLPKNVQFKWKKISDTRFEAEPALLNPGDSVSTYIYLTNTGSKQSSAADKLREAEVEWKARIVNLRRFTMAPMPHEILEKRLWLTVTLEGWAVPFTIITALLCFALYLHLLFQAGFVATAQLRTILLLVGACFLSFAAAESIATYLFTYLFGDDLEKLLGVQHWLNAPWIILNAVVLILLYFYTQGRKLGNKGGGASTV